MNAVSPVIASILLIAITMGIGVVIAGFVFVIFNDATPRLTGDQYCRDHGYKERVWAYELKTFENQTYIRCHKEWYDLVDKTFKTIDEWIPYVKND